MHWHQLRLLFGQLISCGLCLDLFINTLILIFINKFYLYIFVVWVYDRYHLSICLSIDENKYSCVNDDINGLVCRICIYVNHGTCTNRVLSSTSIWWLIATLLSLSQ